MPRIKQQHEKVGDSLVYQLFKTKTEHKEESILYVHSSSGKKVLHDGWMCKTVYDILHINFIW